MERRSRKRTVPGTVDQLRAWLRDTTVGQQLLHELADEELERRCRVCQRELFPQLKVLVVVRRLGLLPGVEVFAEKGVRIRLEELVDTADDPAIERLADELLVAQLPKWWKHLPNCRRRSMPFRGLTAARRLQALDELRTLRELEAWQAKWASKNG